MVRENIEQTVQNRNARRRVRKSGHFRGWVVRTPACIARNIVTSLLLHEANDVYSYVPEHYTDDKEILALVYEMLDR